MATTLPPTGSLSPSTSPRLPSPPPFPEVQIGAKSPSQGATGAPSTDELSENVAPDHGASRRIRPGTKAADMASGPPLIPLLEVSRDYFCGRNRNTRQTFGLTIYRLTLRFNCKSISRPFTITTRIRRRTIPPFPSIERLPC